MVVVEEVVAKVAHGQLALHEYQLGIFLVVFVPELFKIVGAYNVGIELKLMGVGTVESAQILLFRHTAVAVGILAARGHARGVDAFSLLQEPLEHVNAAALGIVLAYLLIGLVAHAPHKHRRMVAVAPHLVAQVAQVQLTHLRPFAVVAVFPLVEKLVNDEHSVAVRPVEHVLRIGVVRQPQAVAAQVTGNSLKPPVPCRLERRRTERSEVGMQAHSVDIHPLAVDK